MDWLEQMLSQIEIFWRGSREVGASGGNLNRLSIPTPRPPPIKKGGGTAGFPFLSGLQLGLFAFVWELDGDVLALK